MCAILERVKILVLHPRKWAGPMIRLAIRVGARTFADSENNH